VPADFHRALFRHTDLFDHVADCRSSEVVKEEVRNAGLCTVFLLRGDEVPIEFGPRGIAINMHDIIMSRGVSLRSENIPPIFGARQE